MNRINLLALSGSLRKASYNTAALKALQQLAPEDVEIIMGQIKDLPLFNPDRENETIPALQELKAALAEADGLIIASPEYAHGISGPLKNALDWLVGAAEFPYKPIMLINTSPRAQHGPLALREVLKTMSGCIVEEAGVTIALLGSGLKTDCIMANSQLTTALLTGLKKFSAAIRLLKRLD